MELRISHPHNGLSANAVGGERPAHGWHRKWGPQRPHILGVSRIGLQIGVTRRAPTDEGMSRDKGFSPSIGWGCSAVSAFTLRCRGTSPNLDHHGAR